MRTGISAEAQEMREEHEAIFGTDQETRELLEFTGGLADLRDDEEGPQARAADE